MTENSTLITEHRRQLVTGNLAVIAMARQHAVDLLATLDTPTAPDAEANPKISSPVNSAPDHQRAQPGEGEPGPPASIPTTNPAADPATNPKPARICGARIRNGGGAICQETALLGRGGKCRKHGGASTGPRTPGGKKRSAGNSGKIYKDFIRPRFMKASAKKSEPADD
jgi:hypothetical protein